MSDRKEQAAHTLIWYFKKVFEKAGLQWDSDNDAEMRGIVDDIVQAAISQGGQRETEEAGIPDGA